MVLPPGVERHSDAREHGRAAPPARFVLLVILLSAAIVRLAVIDRPFIGNSEGLATGWVLSSARNHVRYGAAASRLAGVLNSGVVDRPDWVIYAHHPPLTTLLAAVPIAVAGPSEWSARAAAALFSVATTALIFVLAAPRHGLRPAAVSALIYAFCPMTLALGDMAEYLNAPLVFCGVAAIGSYLRWIETGLTRWLHVFSGLFVAGALSDWPIFYLVPIVGVHALITRRARLRGVLAFTVAALCLFAGLAAWVRWSGGDVSVFHQLSVRTSAAGLTVHDWIARVIVHHQGRLHTWPVLALSAVYVLDVVRRRNAITTRGAGTVALPVLLLAWGLMNMVVGIDGNYRHEWWSMILTPGLALTAALGLEQAIALLPRRVRASRLALPAAVLLGLALLAWSGRAAYEFTMSPWFRGDGFTLESIGTTINQIAGTREGVLTSVDTDHPALWFYADRQLRPAITSVEALDRALGPGEYLVFYDYRQRDGPAPTWFVMPAAHHAGLRALADVLDRRYPRREMKGVVVYRLRQSSVVDRQSAVAVGHARSTAERRDSHAIE